MSHRLFNSAREVCGLSSSEKFVLLMLCDRADEEGRCWPATKVLMAETALCERAVRKALASLRSKGFIASEHQSGCSNSYLIDPRRWPDTPAFNAPAPPPAFNAPMHVMHLPLHVVQETPAPGATPHNGEPPVNHQLTTSLRRVGKNADTDTAPTTTVVQRINGSARFPEFWNAWPSTPRKVAKSKCLENWKRNHLDDKAERIIAHISAMKVSRQWAQGFEPSPMTYLNQRRWEDAEQNEDASAPRPYVPNPLAF